MSRNLISFCNTAVTGGKGFARVRCQECGQVLRMLLSKEKITEALVENLLCWPHSGFHVHQGGRIESTDKAERERVAGYILRAPLFQEKMRYLEEKDQVIYQSGKKGSEKKVFTALDWLAARTDLSLPGGYTLSPTEFFSVKLPELPEGDYIAFAALAEPGSVQTGSPRIIGEVSLAHITFRK